MNRSMILGLGAVVCLASAANAADVYVFSSGDPVTDAAAVAALNSRGHAAEVGVQYMQFDGTQDLSGYQTVLLQANFNWASGVMPDAGQQALVNWVMGGGRLVTTEWVVYYTNTFGGFQILGSILPLEPGTLYGTTLSTTLSVVTADPVIGAGVPAEFTCALTSYTGTEGFYPAKPGATVYYSTSNSPGSPALAGWAQGAGLAFSFTSTCGPDQVGDASFGRLFANVMGSADCTADWNTDGMVNSGDISAFLTAWIASVNAGDLVADFNGDLVTNSSDISAFLTAWIDAVTNGC